jgi:hypothetical protein
METLPPEILAHIFRFACTDGGKNASSLQLVSRNIGKIANMHRFRTISVAGVVAIESLIYALRQSPAELRIIEHLFIADKLFSSAVDKFNRPPDQNEPGRSLTHQVRIQVSNQNLKEAQQIHQALSTLLDFAAENLCSLTLLFFNPFLSPVAALAHHPLTQLKSLSLRYSPWIAVPMETTLPSQAKMPKLQSLKLQTGTFSSMTSLCRHLVVACRCIDHVRLEGVEAGPSLIRFIRDILNERDLPEAPAWAFIDFDVHPVHPDPLYVNPARQQIGKQFMLDIETLRAAGIRVHPMADSSPTFTDWQKQWRQDVEELTQ